MSLSIKSGAFLIGDAHYSDFRLELFDFLQDIKSKKLNPTQLILFGDIFDALFGGVDSTQDTNKDMVDLLNDISNDIDIIYLEGNHDFNLTNIFPKIKIISISKQPLECNYNSKKVFIAHGDIHSSFSYKLYTAIIRDKTVLYCLNIINNLLDNKIIKELNIYLNKKDDCFKFSGFKEHISKRIVGRYRCDYFIEGHFHQNKNIKFDEFLYINLPSFACNQRYFSVKSSEDLELMEEIYLKGDVNGTS